jgi:hypothetical protein
MQKNMYIWEKEKNKKCMYEKRNIAVVHVNFTSCWWMREREIKKREKENSKEKKNHQWVWENIECRHLKLFIYNASSRKLNQALGY